MIISFFIIIAVAASSFYFTDLDSSAGFFSMFLPLVFVASLIALALWLVALFHVRGINQRARPGATGGDWGGFGGDDAGC